MRTAGESIMMTMLKKLWKDEEGATMVEYGLMLALIAVVCIAAVGLIGTGANTMFGDIAASL
jgi:pilus assembly protein Flp/PilA